MFVVIAATAASALVACSSKGDSTQARIQKQRFQDEGVFECSDEIEDMNVLIIPIPASTNVTPPKGQGIYSQPLDPIVAKNAVLNKAVRRRAALVCACRARSQRRHVSTMTTMKDGLIIGGIAFTGVGTIATGIAATEDSRTRTKDNAITFGLIAAGTGAVATAVGAAMKLDDRSEATLAAAADQEVAAAVLLNDDAPSEAWSRAFIMCAQSHQAIAVGRAGEGANPRPAIGSADAGTDGDGGGVAEIHDSKRGAEDAENEALAAHAELVKATTAGVSAADAQAAAARAGQHAVTSRRAYAHTVLGGDLALAAKAEKSAEAAESDAKNAAAAAALVAKQEAAAAAALAPAKPVTGKPPAKHVPAKAASAPAPVGDGATP